VGIASVGGNSVSHPESISHLFCGNNCTTKIMLVKSQNKDKPYTMYSNEPLEVIKSFKYLAINLKYAEEV
jgi:hypothetical protein